MAAWRVVVVGGGASGSLAALHVLRRFAGEQPIEVDVVESRPALGHGIAFGTPDPWHRLNVPSIVMSAYPDVPDDFTRWAGVDAVAFPNRMTWGRYLGERLAEAGRLPGVELRHVRARATEVRDAGPADPEGVLVVEVNRGPALPADAVVIATGNELPSVPPILGGIAGHPRVLVDPWALEALDGIASGATVAILGTGLTALDLSASLIRHRASVHVVAMSRHGEVPRIHEDPWRPKPATPVFDVDAFRAFEDPIAEAEARIRDHPEGWRQGLDSLRPLHGELWRSMDEPTRRRFLGEWRRRWEVHRSRIAAEVLRDVHGWIGEGRLELRAASIVGAEPADEGRIRLVTQPSEPEARVRELVVDWLLLASGPDERAAASPFLAAGLEAGLLRDGPLGLGIDADPDSLRVLDADGWPSRPIWALGPILRGVLFEVIAIPEIRTHAATIAAGIEAELATRS
jgi:uncharacterized NAD(P)/FAD-binding protein YdhS